VFLTSHCFIYFPITTDYLKACNGIKKMTLTMSDILLLRQDNSGIYFDFIEYFVSAVVGKTFYKVNKCQKLLSEFTTISDEALAILILENNFDTWCDMATKNITKNSLVLPKYTNGGTSTGENASTRRYQGWSNEGIKRFNEYHQLVKTDRESSHARLFEESFRMYCEDGGVSGKKDKARRFHFRETYSCLGFVAGR
jgi:hypothetical protein